MPIEYGDGSDSNAGRVVQVVYGIKDDTSSISVSGSGSGNLWSGPSITMSDSNNRVLILGSITLGLNSEQRADIILYRGSSALAIGNSSGSRAVWLMAGEFL